MAEMKTKQTNISVAKFIASVDNETRRHDASVLLKLFGKVTGWKPKMWGPTIVGFGSYHYSYESGRTGSICAVGFSPRKANLVIYVFDFPGKARLSGNSASTKVVSSNVSTSTSLRTSMSRYSRRSSKGASHR